MVFGKHVNDKVQLVDIRAVSGEEASTSTVADGYLNIDQVIHIFILFAIIIVFVIKCDAFENTKSIQYQ